MEWTTNWTEEDADTACREGWNIFECFGSENGPWQICKFDEPELWDEAPNPYAFVEDTDVWEHVYIRANYGSAIHARALTVIAERNPKEFFAIAMHMESLEEDEEELIERLTEWTEDDAVPQKLREDITEAISVLHREWR